MIPMDITIVRVPYDSGHRGLRMGAGPQHLLDGDRIARMAGEGRDVRVESVELQTRFATEARSAFDLAGGIRDKVTAARREQRFPLVLAGNCMAAAGVVAAMGQPAVVWLDAHADLNTPETTRSGFLDGMAISVLLGRCWHAMAEDLGLQPLRDDAVWLVGARDVDSPEEEYLAQSAIHRITASAAGRTMKPRPSGEIYLHIDLDVLDPTVGKVNEFATPAGLSLESLLETIDAIAGSARIGAAALTAYDPSFDSTDSVRRAAITIAEHLTSVVSA
jgi:arginase